jgi:hypothetical protein
MTLDHEDIEAIAECAAHRVVQLLGQPTYGAYQLLDPKELASALNVSLDYIYTRTPRTSARCVSATDRRRGCASISRPRNERCGRASSPPRRR